MWVRFGTVGQVRVAAKLDCALAARPERFARASHGHLAPTRDLWINQLVSSNQPKIPFGVIWNLALSAIQADQFGARRMVRPAATSRDLSREHRMNASTAPTPTTCNIIQWLVVESGMATQKKAMKGRRERDS